jgi:protein-tyrosine phosphatase
MISTGRIDVHSHLIPSVDDGCKTIEQSIECARMLIAAGYTHAFCTPHVWPGFPNISAPNIAAWTQTLQEEFGFAKVPLTLIPGGELNINADVLNYPEEKIVSMALAGRYILTDIWCERLPAFFEPVIRLLQSRGLTVILAHPERCRAIQDEPELADRFAEMGILLQGNLQCFADKPEAHTRRVAEQYLCENRYFLLGSDTHDPQGLISRLEGLKRAIELAGAAKIDELTIANPRRLMSEKS